MSSPIQAFGRILLQSNPQKIRKKGLSKTLKKDQVDRVVREMGQQKAAQHLGVNRSTLRDFCYRNKISTRKDPKAQSSVVLKENEVEITSDPTTDVSDPEKIVKDRGLNPKEWEFIGMTVNEWDSPTGEKLRQLKVQLRRKEQANLILPARTDGPSFKKPKATKVHKDGSLFVFCGDQQAPYHDPVLHEKLCLFLEDQQPHTVVNIGDTIDLPDISRYKANPEVHKPVQDGVDAGYRVLRDERSATPDSHIVKLIGNHDVRLRDFVLANTPQLYGLKRADIGSDDAPILSPQYLLRLDELGIELIGDNANWEHGQFNASKYLAARHGWISTKGAGTSAQKTLEALGYSIIVGHTHRLALIHKTMHDINGIDMKVLAAAESGCLCSVDVKGLGFAAAPDWQQGYATATIWPDGHFKIDLATYVKGNLYWRGNKY